MESAELTKCWVVTVYPCGTPNRNEESPNGCVSCDMMNWLPAFKTKEEANEAFMKQYPEKFDENGKYKTPQYAR